MIAPKIHNTNKRKERKAMIQMNISLEALQESLKRLSKAIGRLCSNVFSGLYQGSIRAGITISSQSSIPHLFILIIQDLKLQVMSFDFIIVGMVMNYFRKNSVCLHLEILKRKLKLAS